MIALPSLPELIQRTKALAALDLILSPEWDYRYYSFNAQWAPHEQMASMRDGCGDEWWLVFHGTDWAALKGLGHESAAWSQHREQLSNALRSVIPAELQGFADEPAFRWEATSFACFRPTGTETWCRANDLTEFAAEVKTGEQELLCHLVGPAEDYVSFALDYYEMSVPLEAVASVFALQPVTPTLVKSLNPETDMEDISDELFGEIEFPRR